MKRRGRLAAPSFFNTDDFRSAASSAACTSASLLHPTSASSIRGGDVPHAFGDDFFSGHESVRGSSLSSSHFGYSQKSFHTSDGNLYSVFSPLQGQRSRSRPSSFLRQHLQQQHEQQHPGQTHQQSPNHPQQSPNHPQQSPSSATSSSGASSNSNRNDRQQQQRWRFQVREERSNNENQSTGSRLFRSSREESRDEDEWFNRHDDIFSKEKQRFYQRSESPVFSRWPHEEERLDISSLLKSKFSSASNAASGNGLFERQDSWSDDEDDGPLNLCLADRRRRRKSSSSSSKSDLEDHHHHLRRRRRHQNASEDIASFFKHDFLLKDDHSTNFRLRRHYHHQEEEREVEEEEDTFFNTRLFKEGANEEPKVLDLSMRNEATPSKRNCDVNATTPQAPPQQHVSHQQELPDAQKVSDSSSMDTEKWLKSAIPPNRKQFPRISEMLEKMHLRDDEWRQAMQVDSYRAALESTRERLIHTHPEMFIGWPPDGDPASKMDVAVQPQSKSNENPHFCKQNLSNLQQQQMPRHMQTTSIQLQTPPRSTSGVKCEEETASLPPLLVTTPLRSCSAVTVNAEMVNKTQPRPLAGSFSCPEVPSLVNRGLKARWINQKGPKGRPPRKSSAETASSASSTVTTSSSVSPFANDISICKFKLVKGLHPVLEEKKTLHVPLPVRSSPSSSPQRQTTPIVETSSSSVSDFQLNFNPNSPSNLRGQPPVQRSRESPLKTFKFHMEGQSASHQLNPTEVGGGGGVASGRATSPGGVQSHNRRVRKRSRKTLAREQLEATFREQGFLIKTQQVSSAEGAVYCKFRQLKKFTRYLFKSWKDHLPLEIQGGVDNMAPPQTTLNENTSTI